MRFSAAIQAAILSDDPKRLRYFLDIQWPSGWLYLHTGIGEREYLGNTYLGVGEFGSIGPLKEDGSISATRLALKLSLSDPSLVNDVLVGDPIGNDALMHLIALDEHQQIIDGDICFAGTIGDMTLTVGAITQVTLSLIDWLEIWNRAIENKLYSDAAQQAMHPGDCFFDQVEILASEPLSSGVSSSPIGSISGGGSPGGSSGNSSNQMMK